jgi:hypothetical protein
MIPSATTTDVKRNPIPLPGVQCARQNANLKDRQVVVVNYGGRSATRFAAG